jgi:hypothetical protein
MTVEHNIERINTCDIARIYSTLEFCKSIFSAIVGGVFENILSHSVSLSLLG